MIDVSPATDGRDPFVSAKVVFPGHAAGEAMVAQTPLPLSGASFEFDTGKVKWAGHDLQGKSVTDKILIVPDMLGFAGGDWALFALSQHYRTGPKAILCGEFNPFVAAGSILGRIPTVAMLPKELLTGIEDGDRIRIDTAKGIVQIRSSGRHSTLEPAQIEFSTKRSCEAPFHLTSEEEAMINGSHGRAVSECLQFLVRYGKVLGATRLLEIESVHAAGSGYNTTGDATISYLTALADSKAKVIVPSSLNPIALDLLLWKDVMRMPANLQLKQERLNDAFQRLGFTPVYSCAPYWTGHVPKRGSNIVWSEHNAVSFANSVLGARTNFESNIATVAAAITGRIPNYGLYLPENRRPSVGVSVTGKIGNAVDWRVLGVAAARVIGNKIPLFRVDSAVPTILNLRDLCAAMGPPWTACPMIHVDGVTAGSIDSPVDAGSLSNTVEITDRELDEVRAQLRAKRDQQIDLVALGCPQYSLDEIRAVADLLERQRVKTGVQLWVWTDRATRATAERLGLVKSIMKAGGEVIADTCGCAACPVSKSEHGFHNVATDSTKSCGFLNSTGLNTQLASLTECIDAAISGILVGPKIRRSSESGSN